MIPNKPEIENRPAPEKFSSPRAGVTSGLSTSRKGASLRAFFLGGLLPLLIFTFVEEVYGTVWGLIAGMIFGAGEIFWEWFKLRKVDSITWGGNLLLLVLGGVSLLTQEGVWFKLQPALIEVCFAFFLWGSLLLKKPLLLNLALKQGALPPDYEIRLALATVAQLKAGFKGLTFRFGLFFFAHSLLATWAALHWSTSAWAFLKGIGLTVTLIVYGVVESLILRYRLRLTQNSGSH